MVRKNQRRGCEEKLQFKWSRRLLVLLPLMAPLTGWSADCRYTVDPSSARLTWTGYKFTEKVGVNGSFDSIGIEQAEGKTPEEVLSSVHWNIDTATINSDNPVRDKKLALYVLGRIATPEAITGRVKSVDLKASKAVAEIRLNDRTQEVLFKVSKKDGEYTFESSIDLLDFGMKSSVDAIHRACEQLHVGADGKSVTWSEIGLKVVARLTENCS